MTDPFWQGRKVLVTGAGGFLGSHMVEALVSEGAHVRAFVRYNSRGSPRLLKFEPLQVRYSQTSIQELAGLLGVDVAALCQYNHAEAGTLLEYDQWILVPHEE